MEYTKSNNFEELRGLTATVISENNSPHIKGQTGIIVDTSVCCARLACLDSRAIFDREKNEYHTIKEYSSAWVRWDDIKINFPIIENYFIVIAQNWGSSLRMVEGEVYSFIYNDKTVKLGINRNVGSKGYNITDLLTGLYLQTDEDINKLRCILPKVAKEQAEYYNTNPMQIRDSAKELHKLPSSCYKTVSLYDEGVLDAKTIKEAEIPKNDYPF